jgi:hypothetical protein
MRGTLGDVSRFFEYRISNKEYRMSNLNREDREGALSRRFIRRQPQSTLLHKALAAKTPLYKAASRKTRKREDTFSIRHSLFSIRYSLLSLSP